MKVTSDFEEEKTEQALRKQLSFPNQNITAGKRFCQFCRYKHSAALTLHRLIIIVFHSFSVLCFVALYCISTKLIGCSFMQT